MSGNGNGVNGAMKLIAWVGGVLGLLITIYTQFHVPLANAISSEKDCRQREDTEIRKEVASKLDAIKDQNLQLAVMMAEIKSDLKHRGTN